MERRLLVFTKVSCACCHSTTSSGCFPTSFSVVPHRNFKESAVQEVSRAPSALCAPVQLRRSDRLARMHRNRYEDAGADQPWNVVADEDFDPHAEEHVGCESPVTRAPRGRRGGGRKAGGRSVVSTPRGQHSDGMIVSTSEGKGRPQVSFPP